MSEGDFQTSPWLQRVLHDDRDAARTFVTDTGSVKLRDIMAPPGLDLHWCQVAGGELVMSGEEPGDDAGRRVVLTAFEMTRVPITNRQYDLFVTSGAYDEEKFWTVYGWRHRRTAGWTGPGSDDGLERIPDAPVTDVSWWEAMAFACWAGASLPSEAQWEQAARESAPRPTGTIDLRDQASRPPSPFGCLDMNGHVAEWCLDNDAALVSVADGAVDPVLETTETAPHVARGGCGLHDASALCGNSRDHYAPGFRDHLVGFRLVRPAI